MALRPILKRSPAPNHRPLAVHFPPTPSLATHTFALSSTAYDRSPIVVLPNSCALPERGCPGRTYTLEEESALSSKKSSITNHIVDRRELHPRAMVVRGDPLPCYSNCAHFSLPPLIPDLSSESDESDSFLHTPLEFESMQHHFHGLAIPEAKYQSIDQHDDFPVRTMSPNALSFLPHPPSPPSRTLHDHDPPEYFQDDDSIYSRPRRRRERKFDAARTPDRIPSEKGEVSGLVAGSPPKDKKTKMVATRGPLSATRSGFNVEEDGCLGGF